MPLPKTPALAIARRAYSMPTGSGHSWAFYGPFYAENPGGPRTEFRNSSYPDAMRARHRMVAETALCLMGVPPEEAAELVGTSDPAPAKELLEACLVRRAISAQILARQT